jgi:phosphatidylserine/phosphatidylglycerophosphate/cardiolipin synthase-like enzyme
MKELAAAVATAMQEVGAGGIENLAAALAGGAPRTTVPVASAAPGFGTAAHRVLTAQLADGVSDVELVAYLRGVAAGYRQRTNALQVQTVWTGPSSHRVPLRATAQVLVDLVVGAHSHLLLMTYSATPYPPLITGLGAAIERDVCVDVVVETLQGAGSALSGAEPAAAFAGVTGAKLWQWAPTARPAGARMHAKIAVADRMALLVSSANLTSSGIDKNIEAGILIHGGTAPLRVVEHFTELTATGVLIRL